METADFTEICNKLWLMERKLSQEVSIRIELEQSLASNASSHMEIVQRAEEYDKLLHSYSQTLDKMDQLFIANEEFKRETKTLSSKLAHSERELVSMEQRYRDVTTQIQHLLYNKVVSPKLSIVPIDDNCTAEEVVNKNLVTFDDVSQLQYRNIELLAVVRKLSNNEAIYPTSPVKTIKTIDSDVTEVLRELSSATEALSSAHEVVNSLTVQRDMLKNLLCSSNAEVSKKIEEILSPNSVNDLKVVISKLEHDNQTLKSELTQSADKIQQKTNTITSLQGELTENSVKFTQLNTDFTILQERYNRIADKNSTLSAEVTSGIDQIKSLNN
jgi:chromosome segregation ATPase